MVSCMMHFSLEFDFFIRLSGSTAGLLQLQMIFSFPFLRAKDLRRSLLIMRTHSFLLSCT